MLGENWKKNQRKYQGETKENLKENSKKILSKTKEIFKEKPKKISSKIQSSSSSQSANQERFMW